MSSTGYAVVSGGGSGIGRALCLALAQRGWTIAVVDCSGETASAVVEEAIGFGATATAEVMDVSDADNWRALAGRLQTAWPRLDLLINSAGNLLTGGVDGATIDDLRRIVEVNLLGTIWGCHTMLPWLKESHGPVAPRGMINMSSIFAAVSPPGFAAYNASKAGVLAFTETLRGELAPHGLTATAVLPGVTPTPLFDRAKYGSQKQAELCAQFVAEAKITAEMVAQQALAGAARGQLYVVVGRRAKLYWRLKRLAPEWVIRLVGRRAVEEFDVLDRKAEFIPLLQAESQSGIHSATPTSVTE